MRHIDIDVGQGDIQVEERFIRPTKEYPQGSYLRVVAGNVEVATGVYEKDYPGHPSLYFHGGAPFVLYDHIDAPWLNDGGGPFDKAVDRVIARVDRHFPSENAQPPRNTTE